MKIPVLVFGYNRSLELSRVLKSLEAQVDHERFDVYVFLDGHRNHSDEYAVKEVYDACRNFDKLIKSISTEPRNIGLRNNILKGIDYIKNDYDSFIVLEDDIVLADEALLYMHTMLERYKDSVTIGHVNLWNFPFINVRLPYISWHMHCWGWGSWTNLWKNSVEDELLVKPSMSSKLLISKFFSTTHYSHFYGNVVGIKRTWAVLWMMRLVRLRLLSVSPPFSLAENIGLASGDNVEYMDYKQKPRKRRTLSTNLASRISGFYSDLASWFYTVYRSPKLALLRTIYLVIFK